MSTQELIHFSNPELKLSEYASRNPLARPIANIFSGSSSPNALQAEWYSALSIPEMTADVRSSVVVPGDPSVGFFSRMWYTALVMAATNEDVYDLLEETNPNRGKSLKAYEFTQHPAVAYEAGGLWHVGIAPRGLSQFAEFDGLFGELRVKANRRREQAVAMRIGSGPLKATMGVYLDNDRHFQSLPHVREVMSGIHVNDISSKTPELVEVHLAT